MRKLLFTKLLFTIAVLAILLLAVGCQQSTEKIGEEKLDNYINVSDDGGDGAADAADEETSSVADDKDAGEDRRISNILSSTKPYQNADNRIIVTEGGLVEIKTQARDPDDDELNYSFNKPLDADGKWQTKEGDVGIYYTNVSVSDGKTTTTKELVIVVKPANRPPVLEKIDNIKVVKGNVVVLEPEVSDPNKDDTLETKVSGYFNTLVYKTAEKDVGEHEVNVSVSDGELEDWQVVKITVEGEKQKPNSPPVFLEPLKDVTIREGSTFRIQPKVSDPDGDKLIITYSGFTDKGEYTASYDDAGDYVIKVAVSDGVNEVSQNVNVHIENVNRVPILQIEWD